MITLSYTAGFALISPSALKRQVTLINLSQIAGFEFLSAIAEGIKILFSNVSSNKADCLLKKTHSNPAFNSYLPDDNLPVMPRKNFRP